MFIHGVRVDPTSPVDAVTRCQQQIVMGQKSQVCILGVHGIFEASKDAALKEIFNKSFLNVPDGMPLAWVLRLQGHSSTRRVYGPDFMLKFIQESGPDVKHYFLGGNVGVAEILKNSILQRFPFAQIVGCQTPPFRPLTESELTETVHKIQSLGADVIWVGLSTPKQEKLIAQLLKISNKGVYIGVGAAFDICSGLLPDAPNWIKASGLQWAHRLTKEPRRLWRRYAQIVPFFLPTLVREIFYFCERKLKRK